MRDTENPDTRMPGRLDLLLRDMHLLWCDDDCDADWHLTGADPELAALRLAMALWEMEELAGRGEIEPAAALSTLNAFLEKLDEGTPKPA